MILKYENWYVPCDGTLAASRAAALSPAFGQSNVIASRSSRPRVGDATFSLGMSFAGDAGTFGLPAASSCLCVALLQPAVTTKPITIMLLIAHLRAFKGRTAPPCC